VNYLSHFVFNHRVAGLPEEPYFALGVALPDLWTRYSRKHRIRWKAVRAAEPRDAIARNLRDGLLNHVATDRRFHVLPVFLRWQKHLKQSVEADSVHPVLLDFLAHAAIEFAMDHALLSDDPDLADHFYDVVAQCDPVAVAQCVRILGDVDTTGLDETIRGFVARRFLKRYRRREDLTSAMQIMLEVVNFVPPPERVLNELLHFATEIARPEIVWNEMRE
jgi:hypothetical protein